MENVGLASEEAQTKKQEISLIRKAINDAISMHLEKRLSDWVDEDSSYYSFDPELVSYSTFGKCTQISAGVIVSLSQNGQESWDQSFVLGGVPGEEGFSRVGWDDHAYGIVKAKSGNWYAFTPANLSSEEITQGTQIQILEADNLEELRKKIIEFEGGEWPSTENIEKLYQDSPNQRLKEEPASSPFDKYVVNHIYISEDGKIKSDTYPLYWWKERVRDKKSLKKVIKRIEDL